MQVGVIVGNPKVRSRTWTLAVTLSDRLQAALGGGDVAVVDVATLGPGVLQWGDAGVQQALDQVATADWLVVASPVYKASYTGLLKCFIDQLAPAAWAGKRAVPMMVGASQAHRAAVDAHLRPLLEEVGARCPTRSLYVLESAIPDHVSEAVQQWLNQEVAAGRLV